MEAKIISGKEISKEIREELGKEIARLKDKGIVPGLATVLVGEDPASKVYIRNKAKACENLGIYSEQHNLKEATTSQELLDLISKLNEDPKIHGILVQLPLPKHIDEASILYAIDPKKDVDGFHPTNVGLFFTEKRFNDMIEKGLFLPCTPHGIIELLKRSGVEIAGKEAVVLGRSNIVGKPISYLLMANDATVTICHSKTKNLKEVCSKADILVVAIGRAKFVGADMVKDGAVVVDVGVNRTEEGLVGDVDFEKVKERASMITPVPGGVGPMTITMLLVNTVKSARRGAGM
jgi:methylenetetrahydrofolate dehydrogenase (NADP+)/methenyltetrahydrofolate cyclohydrolase